MLQKIIFIFTIAAIVGLAFIISPATAGEKQTSAQKPSASAVNGITEAAVRAGALTCASRINQVTNFLIAGTQDARALIFPLTNSADNQLFSLSMEIPLKDSSSVYASASFSANEANGCTGMYETVAYWPQKCAEVSEKNFGSLKKGGTLSKNIIVRNSGESTKIFLMPAGTGCVSIKKEIVR
ncbi:MAG TPA: hypothetical protein VMU29_01505 [Smithella sp.]|nr:hypothetical protein [Smithella sp.]